MSYICRLYSKCSSGSIGQYIRSGADIGGRPQPDDHFIWKAGDREAGVTDETLSHTEFVRTVCGKNTNTVGTNFNFVDAAAFTFNGKGITFLYFRERKALDQYTGLVNFRNVSLRGFLRQQQGNQAAKEKKKKQRRDPYGIFSCCVG